MNNNTTQQQPTQRVYTYELATAVDNDGKPSMWEQRVGFEKPEVPVDAIRNFQEFVPLQLLEKREMTIHKALGYLEYDCEFECARALERSGIPGHSLIADCAWCADHSIEGKEHDDLEQRAKEMKTLRDSIRGLQSASDLETEVVALRVNFAFLKSEFALLVKACDGIDSVLKPPADVFERAWRVLNLHVKTLVPGKTLHDGE